MKRKMIQIDENKCTGCGLCIPNCPEGALQIIDGKARLVSELCCDGLGACLGHCPEDAIKIVEKEAQPYDEIEVMKNIVKQGENTIKAHLRHLQEHGENELFSQAVEFLKAEGIAIPQEIISSLDKKGKKLNPSEHERKPEIKHEHGQSAGSPCGCPGSRIMDFHDSNQESEQQTGDIPSELRQWPLQLHLISPRASYFQGKDLLVSADCVAYAVGSFHRDYLRGKSLVIACPKLDDGQENYLDKMVALIEESKVRTITVMIMEVPCCRGLLEMVSQAVAQAKRKVPVQLVLVGLQGNILKEEWISCS